MALAPGTRIRTYEIVSAIGAGGMGEVYRARDVKLNRDVAIKVLPPSFAGDAERLARFSREAQVLASLNHPNIAHIHGFEDHVGDGTNGALIMELVDGPTLADRLDAGTLPLDETLSIARQIVAALDAAHSQGIVHRDLKPANIKVRDDGTVKVLDFGLAKLASADLSGSGPALANSPTLTAQSTQFGTIVGTAAYMSPEQAKGKPVDKRADIWAFGAVLFEMLAGRPLFEGDTISELLASVLRDDPKWDALPANTPAALRRVLARCLERDPKRRLHDIADVLPDLEESEHRGSAAALVTHDRPARPLWFAGAGLVIGAALASGLLLLLQSGRQPQRELLHLSVLAPAGKTIVSESADGAISPDGRSIAFAAGDSTSSGLWVRRLDNATARELPGTKGAIQPFWSADSARIGFFAEGKLKTVRLDGDTITTICDAPDPRGGTWSSSGEIVFAPSNAGPLMKVSGEGGDPRPVTTPDSTRGETAHRFPYFLPDGEHFVFIALPGHEGHLDVIAGATSGKERKVVASADSGVVYASPGYLIYMRQNGIAAQAFDARRLAVSGDPLTLSSLPVAPPTQWSGAAPVSASADGTLVYYDEGTRNTRFVWFETATGKQIGTVDAPEGAYNQLAIAPNGRYAATTRLQPRSDIWLLDLERGGLTRFTDLPGQNTVPSWSPDSTQIAFTNDSRGGMPQIFVKALDGGSERQLSTDALGFKSTGPWTKDGSAILFTALDPKTAQDIWILPVQGDHTPKPYLRGPANETTPTISADGHYVGYMSDETGEQELYVQSFPNPGEKYRVTTGGAPFGGFLPDGRLAYGKPNNEAYAVSIIPGPPLRTGPPQLLGTLPQGVLAADLAPDLKRMLAIVPAQRNTQLTLSVLLNWTQMLRTRS